MLFATLATSLTLFSTFSAAEPLHLPILQSGGGRVLTYRDHFAAAERTRARYGFDDDVVSRAGQRRGSSQQINITNESTDQYYYAEVSIGTPAQSFKVLVETDSADLWIGGTTCSGCPSGVALYNHSKSSTTINETSVSTGTYGPGSVQGEIFTDIIRMGSYSVSNAGFVVATKVTDDLIASPLSGMIGLAFGGLATAGTPFWQAIIASDQAASPEMGFWLSRVRGTSNPTRDEPGGVFTFGGVNASLYSGNIEFLNVTGTASTIWSLDVSAITVQGKVISVTSSTKQAVLDTGTTAIAGPPADVQAIWAAVPGSSPVTNPNGFYQFPCDTDVNVTVSFGGRTWPISSVDMNLGAISGSTCLGAIFGLTPGSTSSPPWIFGVAFLKNVYTVLRQTPPSVGFAELSTLAGGTGTPSSLSITGSSSTSGNPSQTSGGSQRTSAGSPGSSKKKSNIGAIVGGVIGGLALILLLTAFSFTVGVSKTRRPRSIQCRVPSVSRTIRSPHLPHRCDS
ncbi:aspartyl protease [Mycena leptocephala]|nr:aspartyl protease [Mycena leptocephala]